VLVPSSRRSSLRRRLLAWYDTSRRDLPWRAPQGEADPYRTWLAEVMLQQTRAQAVIPYWRRFIARWPTLDALAAASEDEVLAAWAGLGYYARGRNLLAAARAARDGYGGLPASLEALRALPGFGPYTAGAVASIAFGIRVAAVDGNAARVLSRLFLVEGRPEEPAVGERLRALAGELVPGVRPGDWNQVLMELGATLCGRSPACAACPVAALCMAHRAGREREVPRPRRRAPPRQLLVACALLERGGRWLWARRGRDGLLGGLWELPSAEVPEGAGAAAALGQRLRALGVRARVGARLAVVDRLLTHRRLRLEAYACSPRGAVRTGEGLRWEKPGEPGMGVSTATRRLAEAIAGLGRRSELD